MCTAHHRSVHFTKSAKEMVNTDCVRNRATSVPSARRESLIPAWNYAIRRNVGASTTLSCEGHGARLDAGSRGCEKSVVDAEEEHAGCDECCVEKVERC